MRQAFKNKFIFEIKPKQGVWYTPFVGYPIEEDSLVRGDFNTKSLSGYTGGEGIFSITLKDGKAVRLKNISINKASTPYIGHIFICNKPPSILVFGDMDNPNKQYIVSSSR